MHDLNPIRVLCVFGTLNRGGAETMCMNLFRNIDRSKVVFDFVKHTTKTGAYEEEILSLGGKIYACPQLHISNYYQYIKWWDNHFKNHPEHIIIHGHMYSTAGLYFEIAHKYGRKTILHSHTAGDRANNSKRSIIEIYVRKILLKKAWSYTDYRIACSAEAGEYLFPCQQFFILPNAIDSSKYVYNPIKRKLIREEFNITDNIKLIVVIGRLSIPKNPIGTISICKLLDKNSKNWKLLWCGDGDMRKEIESIIRANELEERIIMAGVRSDIPDILQAADIYIMPSLYEGLPVAAVEAQAAGIPCYCSNMISAETKITEVCTFLPINNWQLWADAILYNPCNRVYTQKQVIAAGFDIRETSKRLMNFYLNISI